MHTPINNNTFDPTGHFADHAITKSDHWPSAADAMAFASNGDAAESNRHALPVDELPACIRDGDDPGTPATATACWPRLQRTLRAFRLLNEIHDLEHIAAGVLDAMTQPVFVLRADGQIDFANKAAQRAMTRLPGIVTSCGRLLRVGEVTSTDLTGPRPPGFAPIALDGSLRRAQLFVTAAGDAPMLASAWPHAHCLLTLVLPDADTPTGIQAWLKALGRHHGLTGAEVRVLGLLAGGQDAAAMAASLGVSMATIRSHIRALFDKTGVRRQAELVRLALAG